MPDTASQTNPFLMPASLPYQLPPFDLIGDRHYAPAFAEGMAEQAAEVDAIARLDAPADFDNTIVALERSGQLLARVSRVFFNLTGAHTNEAMEAVARELAPLLAVHSDSIRLNGALFARIETLCARRATLGLDAESLRLLERYHTDFVRAGAALAQAQKEELKRLNIELATLSTGYSQNVLKEINASVVIVAHRSELDGLSEAAIAAAAEAARARGLDGKYALPLQNTTGQPVLASLHNRALRERIQQASMARGGRGGDFDNLQAVTRIARLRAERAQLLGYASHADYVIADETAGTVAAVNGLLADLARPALANARKEAAELQAIIDAGQGGFTLAAHDWAYYTEKLRAQRYDFDEATLRPYLELNSVLHKGVFFAASRLYGLRFEQRVDLPVYHPDVEVFEVFDADDAPLALFLTDFYARPSKRGGAWMNLYVAQSTLLGSLPVVGNHLNVPKPAEGEPTLLRWSEVITLFHEFGHALHGMLSKVTYPRFSGTNVPRDFVEYPSQVNEMWAEWPEVLKNYARHHETGAAMPAALLEKVMATQKFNQGFATTEYLAAALLDQRWHQLGPEQIPQDALAFEAAALQAVGADFAPVPPRYRSSYFSHVFASGYSAGYYAYIWSEVMDADSAGWFAANGGLTRENGERYRHHVLSRGGTVDALQLFENFQGRAPQVAPLLQRRGLDVTA